MVLAVIMTEDKRKTEAFYSEIGTHLFIYPLFFLVRQF